MIILTILFSLFISFVIVVIGFICSIANYSSNSRRAKASMKRFNYSMETAIRNSRGR